MVFKISNEKFDKKVDIEKNERSFPRSSIHPLEHEKDHLEHLPRSWKICLTIYAVFMYAILFALVYHKMTSSSSNEMSKHKSAAVGSCVFNNRSGICMPQEYCCEGEYVITKDMCSSNQVCCIGAGKKCKDKKNPDFWSFESIPRISSKVLFKNVNQSVVEQAIVTSISAIEKRTYFYEMGHKIGTDMTALTGKKWFSIVGNKDSLVLNLSRFSAYILISINDMKVLLIRVENNGSPLPMTVNKFKDNNKN